MILVLSDEIRRELGVTWDIYYYRIQAYAEETPGRIEKSENAHLQILQIGMSARQRDFISS